MADIPTDLEARIAALEMLVIFQFASQHMQTSDPASAIHRLRTLLLDRADPHPTDADEQRRKAALAAMHQILRRIADLQEKLPRRLVD